MPSTAKRKLCLSTQSQAILSLKIYGSTSLINKKEWVKNSPYSMFSMISQRINGKHGSNHRSMNQLSSAMIIIQTILKHQKLFV